MLALAAVATLLVPNAIASDASSATEGDRAAVAVAAAGAVALVAVTAGSGDGLADRFGGSSEPRTGAAYDADFVALRAEAEERRLAEQAEADRIAAEKVGARVENNQ